MSKYDSAGKQIINRYSQAWTEWVLQAEQIQVQAELSGEFQFFARRNDSLLKVKGRSGEFLSLTELQFIYDKTMDRRLAIYKLMAESQYKLDVFITVIFFLPPPKNVVTIPTAYHKVFMEQETHVDYHVIKIWELDAKAVLQYDNPMLLPFVPLMKEGGTQQIIRRCADKIRELPPSEAAELESYLAVFASYVMDVQSVREILRWEMQVIQESPIIQELLIQKREAWFAEGEQEGEKKGERRATLSALYQILMIRFKIILGQFDEEFKSLNLEELQKLLEVAVTVASIDKFFSTLYEMLPEERGHSI